MTDSDFYKKMYADSWDQSAAKEKRVAQMITRGTKRMVAAVGFGAESTEFLSGTAESHGYEKNYPDLAIDGTLELIEVTGPLTDRVSEFDPLWIRPGKLDFAHSKLGIRSVWIIHHIIQGDLFRAIHLDRAFFERYYAGKFRIVKPFVRGSRTEFVAIECDDKSVVSFERFISYLNNIYPREEWWD